MSSKIWLGLVALVLLALLCVSLVRLVSIYYLDRAARAMANGADGLSAITLLETALRFDPRNIEAYRLLARAYMRLHQPDQALAVLLSARSLYFSAPMLWAELGDTYDALDDPEHAVASYEVWYTEDRTPALLVNYAKLAGAREREGKPKEALAIWRDKVLGLGYLDLYAHWWLAQYYASDAKREAQYRQALQRFAPRSLYSSADLRLTDYQAEAIANIIRDDLWRAETKLSVLTYVVWYGDAHLAEVLMPRLAESLPQDADVWYYLGEYYRRLGNVEAARNAYNKTTEIAPDYALAYLRLGMLAEAGTGKKGDPKELKQAMTLYERFHQLAPEDPLGLKKLADVCELGNCSDNVWIKQLQEYLTKRKPEFVARRKVGDWVLLGYDADEARLARGEPTALWLYWQAPAGAKPQHDPDQYYEVGKRWVQVLEQAQSLMPDGDLEAGQVSFVFPNDIYRSGAKMYAFVSDTLNGAETTVARLIGADKSGRTGLATDNLRIEPGRLYLQAGWVMSEEGPAYLGYRWMPIKRNAYAASRVEPDSWTHYVGVAVPPPGATQVQIWLLSFEARGEVYFDNLLFVPFSGPQGVQPGG